MDKWHVFISILLYLAGTAVLFYGLKRILEKIWNKGFSEGAMYLISVKDSKMIDKISTDLAISEHIKVIGSGNNYLTVASDINDDKLKKVIMKQLKLKKDEVQISTTAPLRSF